MLSHQRQLGKWQARNAGGSAAIALTATQNTSGICNNATIALGLGLGKALERVGEPDLKSPGPKACRSS